MSFAGGSVVSIELGGTDRGADYDAIDVAGTARLGGSLSIDLIGGFSPELGDSFEVLSYGACGGEFDSILLPGLSGGLAWQVARDSGGLTLTAAVPEPSGIVSVILGLAALSARRRRRAAGGSLS